MRSVLKVEQTDELEEWHAKLKEGPTREKEGFVGDNGSCKEATKEGVGFTSEEGIRREQDAIYGEPKKEEKVPKKVKKRRILLHFLEESELRGCQALSVWVLATWGP